jgi:hypothetical protein
VILLLSKKNESNLNCMMTNQYLLFRCTNLQYWGCERAGNPVNILSPVKSARLRTVNSFAFKYGKVEISAKMPTGDWLWPGNNRTDLEITLFFKILKCFHSYLVFTKTIRLWKMASIW